MGVCDRGVEVGDRVKSAYERQRIRVRVSPVQLIDLSILTAS